MNNNISLWKMLIENHENTPKMFRGMDHNIESGKVIPFEFRTRSLDTPKPFHEYANKRSMEKLGIPVRNLVFATLTSSVARQYGLIYEVKPQGDFKIFYTNDYFDFTVDMRIVPHMIIRLFDDRIIKDNDNNFMVEPFEKSSVEFRIRESSTIDELKNLLLEILDSHYKTTFDNVKFVDDYINEILTNIDSYVDSIQQISDLSDLMKVKSAAELMIYSPDGLIYNKI